MNLLRVSGVSKSTDNGFLLDHISFDQPELRKIAVAGETGSGKSTLLKIIAGLLQADSGEVRFEGRSVKGPADQLVPGHPEIAYLSQYFELRNHYRVEELLDMASRIPADTASQVFEVCRIRHLLKRKTDQLSGGEKQRIALARVLISIPKLLILDEPFSNLDLIHKNILKSIISDIGAQLGITCLLASHDPLDTLSWADEMLVLRQGKLLQQGPPEAIYRRPADEYVAGLLGRYNLIPPGKTGLFVERTGIGNVRKSLLIRPEAISIVKGGGTRLKGTVRQLRFMGSYYELDVQVAGMTVIVISREATAAIGDNVGLTVSLKGLWYL
jgi:ABC-type Fe3+/spermidine/putrescine transport system ATPase subunit